MDPRNRPLNTAVAGSLSGLDLSFNFLVEVPWARLAEIAGRVGENPAVSIGITLLANSTGEIQLFGEVAQ